MTEVSPIVWIEDYRRIMRSIQDLCPTVLDDFNRHIKRYINLKMKDGFTLAEATDIRFNPLDGVYEISAGILLSSRGSTIIQSRPSETMAERLCKEYQERNPHVRIDFLCTLETIRPVEEVRR